MISQACDLCDMVVEDITTTHMRSRTPIAFHHYKNIPIIDKLFVIYLHGNDMVYNKIFLIIFHSYIDIHQLHHMMPLCNLFIAICP